MTALLGYIDHCITFKNIMLVTFHYAITMIITPNNTENIGRKLHRKFDTHSFIKRIIYMLAMLVKRNSTYSLHLEMNESLSLGRVLR